MRARALLALMLGCGDGASPEPGLDALIQVSDAQYRPGPFPGDRGGPAAIALASTHAAIPIGTFRERLDGVLAESGRVAAIGAGRFDGGCRLDGFDGAWLVPAGFPDIDTPGLPSVAAVIGLADEFPPGPFCLLLAGSDEGGRFGAPATAMVVAEPVPPPAGELVIELVWDGPADLDIHVVDALGGEAWSDDPNTYVPPPPGAPPDPPGTSDGFGILDRDGNRDCHRDGRPAEHVIWTVPPPAGGYTVRVDARSMCGAGSAAWFVAAYRAGELIAAARGLSVPDDVLQPHGAGAGVLALRFELPP